MFWALNMDALERSDSNLTFTRRPSVTDPKHHRALLELTNDIGKGSLLGVMVNSVSAWLSRSSRIVGPRLF